MIRSAWHRVGQFWRHTMGPISQTDREQARLILGPNLAPLFFQMPLNEQRHGLQVLRTLRKTGADDELLLQAALLHDVGKTESRISVIERSWAVFLKAASPPIWNAWLRWTPGFRRRYDRYEEHAAIGAAQLRAVGATTLADVIAEHHATTPSLALTHRLREADGMN